MAESEIAELLNRAAAGEERDPLLAHREHTHGKFTDTAMMAQSLKQIIKGSVGYANLTAIQRESLDQTCTKLARICSGNPDEPEHWKDIAGYAGLVEETL